MVNFERGGVGNRNENREDGGRKRGLGLGGRLKRLVSFDERSGRQSEREVQREQLVSDYGITMLNKGELIGRPERRNEDQGYLDPENGVFAVFDGAGGVRGGAEASTQAVRELDRLCHQKIPRTPDDMRTVMMFINESVKRNPEAGVTTGVIGKIANENGRRSFLFGSVGDSRIYIANNRAIQQLTKDEGEGNIIWNSLGREDGTVRQIGWIEVNKGDRILFCSDGITGDFEKDFIPVNELHGLMMRGTAKQASANLVRRATKKDDRTAIVVEVC